MDMTLDQLKKICKAGGFYRTPELNEVLYFHYKGFTKIEPCIAEYNKARCLWLEGNALTTIENLEPLQDLRQVYLQENLIKDIRGLDTLTNLVSLNLANNFIGTLQGLSALPNLKSLNLKQNRLRFVEDVMHLTECPNIETLNLSENKIEDEAVVDQVFCKMPELLTIYAQQNPFCTKIKPYRKTILGKIPALKFLDDRPVFPDERRTVNAWFVGGLDAEKTERETIRREELERAEKNRLAFKQIVDSAKREVQEMKLRGESLQNTDFHKQNYTKRSAEDEWYTEERRKNKERSEEVKRMEKEMLLEGPWVSDEEESSANTLPKTTPTPDTPQIPAPKTADPTSPKTEEQKTTTETANEAILPTSSHHDPFQGIDSEHDDDGDGDDDNVETDNRIDATPTECSASLIEELSKPRFIHGDCLKAPRPALPDTQPARPMVWGTPAYDALWKQAVAAGEEMEKEEEEMVVEEVEVEVEENLNTQQTCYEELD